MFMWLLEVKRLAEDKKKTCKYTFPFTMMIKSEIPNLPDPSPVHLQTEGGKGLKFRKSTNLLPTTGNKHQPCPPKRPPPAKKIITEPKHYEMEDRLKIMTGSDRQEISQHITKDKSHEKKKESQQNMKLLSESKESSISHPGKKMNWEKEAADKDDGLSIVRPSDKQLISRRGQKRMWEEEDEDKEATVKSDIGSHQLTSSKKGKFSNYKHKEYETQDSVNLDKEHISQSSTRTHSQLSKLRTSTHIRPKNVTCNSGNKRSPTDTDGNPTSHGASSVNSSQIHSSVTCNKSEDKSAYGGGQPYPVANSYRNVGKYHQDVRRTMMAHGPVTMTGTTYTTDRNTISHAHINNSNTRSYVSSEMPSIYEHQRLPQIIAENTQMSAADTMIAGLSEKMSPTITSRMLSGSFVDPPSHNMLTGEIPKYAQSEYAHIPEHHQNIFYTSTPTHSNDEFDSDISIDSMAPQLASNISEKISLVEEESHKLEKFEKSKEHKDYSEVTKKRKVQNCSSPKTWDQALRETGPSFIKNTKQNEKNNKATHVSKIEDFEDPEKKLLEYVDNYDTQNPKLEESLSTTQADGKSKRSSIDNTPHKFNAVPPKSTARSSGESESSTKHQENIGKDKCKVTDTNLSNHEVISPESEDNKDRATQLLSTKQNPNIRTLSIPTHSVDNEDTKNESERRKGIDNVKQKHRSSMIGSDIDLKIDNAENHEMNSERKNTEIHTCIGKNYDKKDSSIKTSNNIMHTYSKGDDVNKENDVIQKGNNQVGSETNTEYSTEAVHLDEKMYRTKDEKNGQHLCNSEDQIITGYISDTHSVNSLNYTEFNDIYDRFLTKCDKSELHKIHSTPFHYQEDNNKVVPNKKVKGPNHKRNNTIDKANNDENIETSNTNCNFDQCSKVMKDQHDGLLPNPKSEDILLIEKDKKANIREVEWNDTKKDKNSRTSEESKLDLSKMMRQKHLDIDGKEVNTGSHEIEVNGNKNKESMHRHKRSTIIKLQVTSDAADGNQSEENEILSKSIENEEYGSEKDEDNKQKVQENDADICEQKRKNGKVTSKLRTGKDKEKKCKNRKSHVIDGIESANIGTEEENEEIKHMSTRRTRSKYHLRNHSKSGMTDMSKETITEDKTTNKDKTTTSKVLDKCDEPKSSRKQHSKSAQKESTESKISVNSEMHGDGVSAGKVNVSNPEETEQLTMKTDQSHNNSSRNRNRESDRSDEYKVENVNGKRRKSSTKSDTKRTATVKKDCNDVDKTVICGTFEKIQPENSEQCKGQALKQTLNPMEIESFENGTYWRLDIQCGLREYTHPEFHGKNIGYSCGTNMYLRYWVRVYDKHCDKYKSMRYQISSPPHG